MVSFIRSVANPQPKRPARSTNSLRRGQSPSYRYFRTASSYEPAKDNEGRSDSPYGSHQLRTRCSAPRRSGQGHGDRRRHHVRNWDSRVALMRSNCAGTAWASGWGDHRTDGGATTPALGTAGRVTAGCFGQYRRTYPLPRMVWMIRGPCASNFRRSELMWTSSTWSSVS